MPRITGKSDVIPGFRYVDAPAAIEWLCRVFGFTEHLVVPGPGGTIAHAQLTLGGGMIMLGSAMNDEYGSHFRTPQEAGGNTQTVYIVIDEIDAHYQNSMAEGAPIIMEIADQDYGGRLYSALDPEGHLWHFGSYDPWAPA